MLATREKPAALNPDCVGEPPPGLQRRLVRGQGEVDRAQVLHEQAGHSDDAVLLLGQDGAPLREGAGAPQLVGTFRASAFASALAWDASNEG